MYVWFLNELGLILKEQQLLFNPSNPFVPLLVMGLHPNYLWGKCLFLDALLAQQWNSKPRK